MNKKKLKRREE